MSNTWNAPPGVRWSDDYFYPEDTACPNPDCGEPVDHSMESCESCGLALSDEDFEPAYWDGPEWEAA